MQQNKVELYDHVQTLTRKTTNQKQKVSPHASLWFKDHKVRDTCNFRFKDHFAVIRRFIKKKGRGY